MRVEIAGSSSVLVVSRDLPTENDRAAARSSDEIPLDFSVGCCGIALANISRPRPRRGAGSFGELGADLGIDLVHGFAVNDFISKRKKSMEICPCRCFFTAILCLLAESSGWLRGRSAA